MATKAIPDGFVLLASYDERVGREHKRGPKGDYAKMLHELSKERPCIAAYKDGGQWVAREEDIKEFLADVHGQKEAPATKRKRADRVRVLLDGSQAEGLFRNLCRIADALENMATRPAFDAQAFEDKYETR